MLAAVMGALAATSTINFDWGRVAEDDDDTPAPAEGETEGAAAQGDLLDFAERDTWLEGWTDDEYASGDQPAAKPVPGERLSGMPVVNLPLPNEDGAERDPWLDGWTNDEYVSTDEAPPLRMGAGAANLNLIDRG